MAHDEAAWQDRRGKHKDDAYDAEWLEYAIAHATDPRLDKSRIIEIIHGGISKNGYGQILKSEAFLSWCSTRKRRLLWVQGECGSGKTMQLCRIIDELQQNAIIRPGFLSFFFCQSTDTRKNSSTAVLQGLLFLLVQKQPSLLKQVQKRHRRLGNLIRSGDDLDTTKDVWRLWAALFVDIVQCPTMRSTGACFCIDALDECTAGLHDLLDLIVQTSMELRHIKWVVTSHKLPESEERLRASDWDEALLCLLRLDPETISATMRVFISDRVQQLADKGGYDDTTACAIQEYLTRANGTAVWTFLVCRSLENVLKHEVLAQVQAYPLDIDSLYAYAIKQIKRAGHGDQCSRLLATVTVAHGPIKLQEMALLLEISEDALAERLRQCMVFLAVYDNAIYFVHSSAKTFLHEVLRVSDDTFAADLESTDSAIAFWSLRIISTLLHRDIYNLKRPGCTIDQIRQPDPDPLAALAYSSVYWVDHLHTGDSSILALGGPVDLFLRTGYLYWLEALSLLRRIPEGVRAMKKLWDILRYSEAPKASLQDLMDDACQFLVTYCPIIAQAPLQVYASALLFSPANSLIRELFKAEEPRWKAVRPKYHSRSVRSVVFSPADGETIASASDDTTVKIWNASSSVCIRSLQGHTSDIWSLTFSRDGQTLVSAGNDNTIRVWHMSTGQCAYTLDGHNHSVFSKALELRGYRQFTTCVAFSHNNELVAFGGYDCAIRIWDAVTGAYRKTLQGHRKIVFSLAFWKNRRLLSSGRDEKIKIWDILSGKCLTTLKHSKIHVSVYSHDGKYIATVGMGVKIWHATKYVCLRTMAWDKKFYAVKYSPDDTLLATAGKCSFVSLWSSSTGQCLQTFHISSTRAYSLAFSHHSGLLACGSRDGLVYIWNTTTGKVIQKLLHQPKGVISGLEFTRDDQRILTSSLDRLVKVWSPDSSTCLHEFKAQDQEIFSITLSHNGRQLATASMDRTVNIWNVVDGGSAWAVSFSRDGHLLAACSDTGAVSVWDLSTGKCRTRMQHHTDAVYATSFSHDNQRIAAASYDNTITISLVTGKLLRKLKGHTGSVWAVAYSPDSKHLVSASNDRTIRLWDAELGSCLQVVNVGTSLSSIYFDKEWDEENSNCGLDVHTEIGRIQIIAPQSLVDSEDTDTDKSVLQQHNYGLSPDRRWVTDNGENVLFLPPECRSLVSAVCGRRICIGCQSGHIVILEYLG